MIPLILLHIALAQVGQPKPHDCPYVDDGTQAVDCHGNVYKPVGQCGIDGQTGVMTDCPTFYGERNTKVGPAEHVIEIRTKRETQEPICDREFQGNNDPEPRICKCPAGFDTLTTWLGGVIGEGTQVHRCERVTKTLWIDNQRVGVIREVEEKP